MTTCNNLLGAVAWSIYCSSLGNWVRVVHLPKMSTGKIPQLPGNCYDFLLMFAFKNYTYLWFLVLQLGEGGRGITYCEITTIARLHFTPYRTLKQWLPFVICHRTLFFSCLGVRFLFFSHLLFLNSFIFSVYLSEAFYFFFNCLLFFLFWSCQVPDLAQRFTLIYYVVCLRITYL